MRTHKGLEMDKLDDTRHCPMCEDSAKKILELEQQLSESMCREEALRHENHNLNWALGSAGYGKMYLPEEQEAADQAHAETLERIATMKKRGDKLAELEQRVKVLTDASEKLSKFIRTKHLCGPETYKFLAALDAALNATPQQTAEQIERWHVEWMKTSKITDEMLAAGADMFEKTLHSSADFKHHAAYIFEAMCDAIPQLPETKEPTK